MSLQEKACLVNLKIQQWTARKLDKKATSDVCSANNTTDAWTKATKALLPESSIKPLRQFCREIRAYHYSVTLPWDDAGCRILSTKAYFEYVQCMNTFSDEFDVRVDRLCSEYDELKAQAKSQLNGLYSESDYPPSLRGKYNLGVHFTPIPTGADMRISIGQHELSKVRSDIEDNVKVLLNTAVSDVYDRIKTVVGACRAKLADSKAVFRDSLITNIMDLSTVIPKLNILDDPAIDALANRMRADLTAIKPDELRTKPQERAAVATKAQSILDGMAGLMSQGGAS